MFLLKIMSDQNLPDNDMTKNYKMIAIGSGDQFEFYHDSDTGLPMVQVVPKEGERYSVELTGNAYVVSETGKTVSSHWARSLWGRKELKITLDKNDPAAEETVQQIQSIVMNEAIKISGNTKIEKVDIGTNGSTVSKLSCIYYTQVLHIDQEPALFNVMRPAHAQMYNRFDNVFILNAGVYQTGNGDTFGDGIISGMFAVNVNDLFTETDADGYVVAYTIIEANPVKHDGEHGYYVKFKSLGTLSKLQRDNLDDKTVSKVKQPATVGALAEAELARRALLNAANPIESKIMYTA